MTHRPDYFDTALAAANARIARAFTGSPAARPQYVGERVKHHLLGDLTFYQMACEEEAEFQRHAKRNDL